jgi:superfamily II DNA or RNA helicase
LRNSLFPLYAKRRALETIATAYDSEKRFVIVEAPTGLGKSGIAKAVTDTFGTARFWILGRFGRVYE